MWWRVQVKKYNQMADAVQEACLRGEYERGLRLVENLKQRRSTPPIYFLLQAEILYQLGKLSEAECSVETGLKIETEASNKADAREVLGKVYTEQKRYDEAVSCFEASLVDCPDSGSGHRAIAEVYLLQGIRAADALGSARLGVKLARAVRARSKQFQDLKLSEAQATLAWAVAAHEGDAAEVDRLLADAFLLCGEEYRPVRAHLNCLAASAYLALGTPKAREKSAGHLNLACIGDSVGNFGRRAKAGLEAAV
jgi:tetratricopeptide (TPR) repeat protein